MGQWLKSGFQHSCGKAHNCVTPAAGGSNISGLLAQTSTDTQVCIHILKLHGALKISEATLQVLLLFTMLRNIINLK